MPSLLFTLDMIGIMAFAASGALVAGRKDMDLFGGLVLAFVTGIGGGTMRDMILDLPVFWLKGPAYLAACLAGFLLVYIAQTRFHSTPKATINFFDAIGLGIFTIIGADKALIAGYGDGVALMMGMLTGCGGGILRDILANEIPLVLSRKRLYATASLAGALVFLLLTRFYNEAAVLAGVVMVLFIRLGALFFDWRLPVFPMQRSDKSP